MYGKLFAQMYDGTLGTKGPWQALVTFQQMIILADKEGVVDMTPDALARRTTIPLDILTLGLEALELPDPQSRSPDEEGRRIVRLSDDRAWGWRIVNYEQYRRLRSEEERREYHKLYARKRRASTKSTPSQQSQPIAVSSKQNAKAGSRSRGKGSPDIGEAALLLAQIKALAETQNTPAQGVVQLIRREKVAELGGETLLGAYDALGGSGRILATLPEKWGLLTKDFADVLASAREG